MTYLKQNWCEKFAVASVVVMTACGGSTSDDSTDKESTTVPGQNTSNLVGGASTMNTPSGVGGARTVGSLTATGGSQAMNTTGTGGIRAAGGQSGTTEATYVGGATGGTRVSTGGSSQLLTGGTFALAGGGGRPLGGMTAIGGTYASGNVGGAVQTGGASATGGSGALGDAVCLLPTDRGGCDAFVEKYYFNASTGQCFQFPYGGCDGNANRFETIEACQQRCQLGSLCPRVIPPTDQALQCALSSVCYYDVTSSCGCTFNSGHCEVIDRSCEDPGEDADASTASSSPDAGGTIEASNQAVVCACGTSGWSCREITLYSGGVD
jgi:hypothetical protein